MDFILGMVLASALFGIFAVLLVLFIFPVAIRFDNFEAPKKDIIIIMINTIILMAILVAIYDFYLPMTTEEGATIMHGYPYRTGPENQASYKSDYFDLGGYLIHWYGYVWWGFIQQYLFMSYFLRLLYKIFPHSKGYLPAGLSCLIFGIIHFPDWPLMLFTGIAGFLWSFTWQKNI